MDQILKIGQRTQVGSSGSVCIVEEFLGGGGQGEVYRAKLDDKAVALKWYYPGSSTAEQRKALEILIKRGAPSDCFLWPIELAAAAGLPGFGYIMPLRAARFKGIVDMMKRRIEPGFRALVTAGLELSNSFLQLHTKGLCYRDISFGNAFFDPATGEVLICDNDNVAVDNQSVGGVYGTPRFMAPEIVRGEAVPSTQTDLFSLAVLLFYMFMMHHPLEGKRELAIKCLDLPAMKKLYGTEPLFIFDPSDQSNAPDPQHQRNAIVFWQIYPEFLRDLFTKAFTEGISDPQHGRVRESNWRAAMVRLRDSIIYCSHCNAENFHEEGNSAADNKPAGQCWSCKRQLKLPPRIWLGRVSVMLNHDTSLFAHHTDEEQKYNFAKRIGGDQASVRPDSLGFEEFVRPNMVDDESQRRNQRCLTGAERDTGARHENKFWTYRRRNQVLKRLDESVPRKLEEILIAHGQSPLTDARLCENLLKDYCGEHKEEISLLVMGVKERIAIDLLVSQEAIEQDILHGLLTKRLRRNSALSEGEARWVVDSWASVVRALIRAGVNPVSDDALSQPAETPSAQSGARRATGCGIVSQCRSAMRSVAWSPLNESIAAGADDGCVRLWDPHTGETQIIEECAGPVSSVRFSPNGVLLATINEETSDKSRVRLWDLQANEPLDLGEVGNHSSSLAFSAGGTRLAAASAEPQGVIRVWNLQNGQTQTLRGPWGGPTSISFSPDGKLIAAADATLSDVAIRLWNLDTGTAEVLGHTKRQITSVAFSPKGGNVATGSWDETVCLWNVSTKRTKVLGSDCSCVNCVAFAPQGDEIAACSLDSKIRIWNIGNERSRTVGTCDNVNDLAFSSDGAMLATASADGTIRLWDARVQSI